MKGELMNNNEEVYSRMLMAEKVNEGEDNKLNHNGDCLKRLTFNNEAEKDRYFDQETYSWPHSSPGSVYVVAIGNRWKKNDDVNCEILVRDMIVHTQEVGYKLAFEEIAVWFGSFPNPSVMAAREEAAFHAIQSGLEYTFFIDNDIIPKKDLLINLLSFNLPMIVPMVIDGEHNIMIGGPIREKNSGVYDQKWTSMSALLIKTSLLSLPGVRFGDNDIEGIFFQRFARWAHTVHMDTSQILYTVTPPTRPDSLSYEERDNMNRDRYDHIFEERIPLDKIAIDLFNEAKNTSDMQVVKTIKM